MKIKKTILVLFITAFIIQANAQTSPDAFYKTIISNVEKAEGRVLLYLNGGFFQSNHKNRNLVWDAGTGIKATVEFKINQGKVDYLKIGFSPKLKVAFKNDLKRSNCFLSLETLVYDSDGDVNLDQSKYSGASGCGNTYAGRTIANFESNTDPENLFTGTFLKNTNSIKPCDEKGNLISSDSKLLNRVYFAKSSTFPALLVLLRDKANIKFSTSATSSFDNYVQVKSGSVFEFNKIDYDIDDKTLDGELERVDFSLYEGTLGNDKTIFKLGNGSIKIGTIDFEKNSFGSHVNLKAGSISCVLGKGSSLAISDGVPNTKLLFDDNSSANFVDFNMDIQDKKYIKIYGLSNSTIKVNVFGGTLNFGSNGYLNLSSGNLNLSILSANWSTNSRPDIKAKITELDAQVGTGKVFMNNKGELELTNGTLIQAKDMNLNTTINPIVTGTIEKITLEIAENSNYQFPRGFAILTDAGSRVTSNDLSLIENVNYPVGKYVADIKFKKLKNDELTTFAFHDGTTKFFIENLDNGTIVGSNSLIEGKVDIGYDHPETGAKQTSTAETKIDDLTFNYSNSQFTASGNFSGFINLGNSLTINSPHFKIDCPSGLDDCEFQSFPIELTPVDQRLTIPITKVLFRDNIVNLHTEIVFRIKASVKKQDFFTAHGEIPIIGTDVCKLHLFPDGDQSTTLTIKTKIDLPSQNAKIGYADLNISASNSFVVGRDGCDIGNILAFVGALTGGPFAAIIGKIAGDKLDNIADGIVQNMINKKFAEGEKYEVVF